MRGLTGCTVCAVLLAACGGEGKAPEAFAPEVAPLPAGPKDYAPVERFEAMKVPADNPMTAEKAALGRQLFFDTRLSGDGKLSCYSCHVNEHGLSDGKPIGEGAFGKPLARNSPTLWNVGYLDAWYWDGRAKTLEAQVKAAWTGVNMGASKPEETCAKLAAIPGYRAQFHAVFGEGPTPENVCKALACFLRTIVSRDTPWDRWQRGDEAAASDAAKRGYAVFQRSKCDTCHAGVLFTSKQHYNAGIGMRAANPDVGRFKVTNEEKDKGAFKAPTLRDVADSGPYFHDGSVPALEEAVKVMAGGGLENPWIDEANLRRVDLTDAEFADLLEFLRSLDEGTKLVPPPLPPDPATK